MSGINGVMKGWMKRWMGRWKNWWIEMDEWDESITG